MKSLSRHAYGSARKGLIAAVCVGLFLVATPVAALATAPDRGHATPTTFDFPAGLVCSFPLEYAEGPNKEVVRVYSDGHFSVTGSYKVTLTNLDTGRTLGVNASGPQFFAPSGAVVKVTGLQIFVLFPADIHGPGVYVFKGKTAYVRDENGTIVSITNNGTRSGNLCNALT